MSLPSLTPEETLSLLISGNNIVFNTVAASAFFFWEYCITFSEEVNLVWRRRWGVINCLFMFIRYGSVCIRVVELIFYTNLTGLIHPTRAVCQNWVKFEVVGGHTMLLSIDILLATRTYAFYGRDRRILILLICIILAGQAASIAILVVVMPGFVSIPSPVPPTLHFGACLVAGADPRFPNYLLPTLVVETCLTLLVATKFIYNKLTTKTPTPHMLMVFIRDGAWAFALVFAILVWTIVTYNTNPLKGDVAITWLFTVISFCGTRLVLNLRSQAPGRHNMFSDNMPVELYPLTPISPVSPYSHASLKFEASYSLDRPNHFRVHIVALTRIVRLSGPTKILR